MCTGYTSPTTYSYVLCGCTLMVFFPSICMCTKCETSFYRRLASNFAGNPYRMFALHVRRKHVVFPAVSYIELTVHTICIWMDMAVFYHSKTWFLSFFSRISFYIKTQVLTCRVFNRKRQNRIFRLKNCSLFNEREKKNKTETVMIGFIERWLIELFYWQSAIKYCSFPT